MPATNKWLPLAITQEQVTGGFNIVLTTDVSCHLYLYWTNKAPWVHRTSKLDRGLTVPWDAYWCYVVWTLLDQEEPGDTTTHTYNWTGWENCQTKYFRFHGTIAGNTSPSDSPIFHKHYFYAPPEYTRIHFNTWESLDNWDYRILTTWALANASIYTSFYYSPPSCLRLRNTLYVYTHTGAIPLYSDCSNLKEGRVLSRMRSATPYGAECFIYLGIKSDNTVEIEHPAGACFSAWEWKRYTWGPNAGGSKTTVTSEYYDSAEEAWKLIATIEYDPLTGTDNRIAIGCLLSRYNVYYLDDTEIQVPS